MTRTSKTLEVQLFYNLNIKDVKEISRSFNPFLTEVVEIWAELSHEEEITSVDSFLSQILWNNSLIRIMGKPVFYKNLYQMEISTVSDIIKENQNCFFFFFFTLGSAHLLRNNIGGQNTLEGEPEKRLHLFWFCSKTQNF